MKKVLLLGTTLALVACGGKTLEEAQNARIADYGPKKSSLKVVENANHYQHLSFLASDEMKGRDTGSDELKLAAKYLATHLESYGFKGIGKDGSFFQPFPVYKSHMNVSKTTFLYNKKPVNLEYGKDFAAFAWGSEDLTINAPVTTVSYGNNMGDQKDYTKSAVNGKIAVRFDLDKKLREKNIRSLSHQSLRNTLYENHAKAVILVLDENERIEKLFSDYIKYDGMDDELSREKEKNPRAYIVMKRSAFNKLLKHDKKKRFSKTKPYTFKHSLEINIPSKSEKLYTQNVVAVLEGSDPVLKHEYVGFGSHYDHDGIKNGEIYNGANDDGSGTVGVLSVAKALSQDRPKRSTLIVFHTGEEKGLWGSEYFVENPLVPLDKIVAMINIDMIGSDYETHKIYVVGADRISQDLHDINEKMNNASVKIELDYRYNAPMHPEMLYYRSDHYNYGKKGIPVIFFNDNDPEHYHKPNDDVEFINFKKLKRVAQLAYATGYYVANQPERIKITNPVKPAIVTKEFAAPYLGKYHMNVGFTVSIEHIDGIMYLIRGTDDKREMKYVDNHLFNGRGLPLQFKLNEKGIATQLTVKVMGREFEGAKDGYTLETKQFAVSKKVLDSYIGNYIDPTGRKFTLSLEKDALMVESEGRDAVPFSALSETEFEFKIAGIKITFKKDDAENVIGFDFNMRGKDLGLVKKVN